MKTAIFVASLVVLTACSSGPIIMPESDGESRGERVERPATPDRPEPEKPSNDKPDAPTPGKPDKPDTPSKPDKPDVSTPSKPDKPDTPEVGKSKGNASANNGKGGNYDKTGHTDNGKGNR